ncbi:hypothetical protein NQ314_009087 [Rhamnusium bicolor]|uniref:UAS domain-containing protein n=1 Tax=Rhamnusium bicolor TaxID=1586634 RepID=A0AAV8Y2T4_9CUCU|nr:hypothetical protein NQ314_009087 [Rhamnusium bicolor]
MEFIRAYEEKYSREHPVFYQGTFAQVLNDAKRELRFLLIYLHDADAPDTELFCKDTLSNREVVRYINQNFLFWGCSSKSDEGRRTLNAVKANYYPFLGVLVLKDNRMTIVGRLEGHTDPGLLVQRLTSVVNEFEINLVSARADRFEASINRSLRSQQDEAFMESLRADQEKERRREEQRMAKEAEKRMLEEEARAEEERRQSIAREKIDSISRVPSEPEAAHPDAVHVVFKLPCGSRLERRFLKTHSLERVLKCRPENAEIIETLEEAGLKNREVLFVNDLDA